MQLRSTRIQLQDGKLAVQGKLFFFVLYRAEDEGASTQWLEQVIPFEGEVACGDCTEEMIPDIEVMLAQEKLQVKERYRRRGSSVFSIWKECWSFRFNFMKMRGRKFWRICIHLQGIFCLRQRVALQTVRDEKCIPMQKASGKIQVQGAKPQVLQVAHVTGSIKIDQVKAEEGGIRIEGAVPVSVLYISSDDSTPFAVIDGTVPFGHFAEVPGLDEKCRFTVLPSMEQLSATMADSERSKSG